MVKSAHEALHRIFREDPQLFAHALEITLGVEFPQLQTVSTIDTDLTEMLPIERRVDSAFLVEVDGGEHLIVVESQTRPDESRRFSWPYYVSYLHNKYQCPVTLFVVTADNKTARWARKPIQVGLRGAPTQTTCPLVLAPDNVPVVRDQHAAERDVMMAVFSALTHREGPHISDILDTLAAALGKIDVGTAGYLMQFVEVGLVESEAAIYWRKLMTTMAYPYQSKLRQQWTDEGKQEGKQEGRLEGEAIGLLHLLAFRGLAVSDEIERRVRACNDEAQMKTLLERAKTVERAEDLFA